MGSLSEYSANVHKFRQIPNQRPKYQPLKSSQEGKKCFLKEHKETTRKLLSHRLGIK